MGKNKNNSGDDDTRIYVGRKYKSPEEAKAAKRAQNRASSKIYRARYPDRAKAQSVAGNIKWRANNKESIRNGGYRVKYGVTLAEFNNMLENCGGLCEICRKPESIGKTLSVDHCHTTDKVRGLLCRRCNIGLGYFKDSITTMNAAVQYIKRTSHVE